MNEQAHDETLFSKQSDGAVADSNALGQIYAKYSGRQTHKLMSIEI